jgi:ribosomal protein S17E
MQDTILSPVDIEFNQHTSTEDLIKRISNALKDQYGDHPHFKGIVTREAKQFSERYPNCFSGDVRETVEQLSGDFNEYQLN